MTSLIGVLKNYHMRENKFYDDIMTIFAKRKHCNGEELTVAY